MVINKHFAHMYTIVGMFQDTLTVFPYDPNAVCRADFQLISIQANEMKFGQNHQLPSEQGRNFVAIFCGKLTFLEGG